MQVLRLDGTCRLLFLQMSHTELQLPLLYLQLMKELSSSVQVKP